MKTILRFLSTGVLTAAIIAVGMTAGFGQDATATPNPVCADIDGANALYGTFTELFKQKGLEARKKMIETAKQFLEKWGACEAFAEQNTYFKQNMAAWEKAYAAAIEGEANKALYQRFDTGVQGKNWDEAYAAGKAIIAKFPDKSLDQMLTLGAIGLYESYAKNNKYNDDTIRYAKMALERINAGATSGNQKFGVFQFGVGSKENAISEMNYAIGYITFHVKGDKKGALPFYYEVSQRPGKYKDDVRVYQTIGSYYFGEFETLRKEYAAIAATQKPEDTPEVRAQQDAQLKEKSGLINAYLERALDAYGRAHKLMKEAGPKAELYKNLQELYKLRFQKTEGLDSFLATTTAKPLPNPTSPVTPIIDEPTPTTTTTTTTTTAPATKPTSATTTPTKPVSSVAPKSAVAKKGTRK